MSSKNIKAPYECMELKEYKLLDKKYSKNNFTIKIVDKFIIPYFQKLTTHLENTNIPSTNNKIENIFQKIFPKHIKRTMKIEQGLLRRFMLKLNHWNIKNKKRKKSHKFLKVPVVFIYLSIYSQQKHTLYTIN